MDVLFVHKISHKTIYFKNALAIRTRRNAGGCDMWVIETVDDQLSFTAANWHVYIQYNENK